MNISSELILCFAVIGVLACVGAGLVAANILVERLFQWIRRGRQND